MPTLRPLPLVLVFVMAASAALATSPTSSASPDGASAPRATPSAAETARASSPAAPLPPLVLVLPFTARPGTEPEWLSWGIAELVGEGMSLAGYRVVDPEAREEALDATGLDGDKRIALASACELGRRVGARYAVTGTWREESNKLGFTAKIIDVSRLKLVREGSASAHVSLVAPALGGIVLDITGDAGRAPAARRQLERLSALKQDALMAWMQAQAEPDNALSHLAAALAADPSFDRARVDLAEAQLASGRPEIVAATLQAIGPDAALPHRARAKVLLGRATLAVGDAAAAVALLHEGVRLDPQPEHLLSLGDAQLAAGDRDGARGTARRLLEMVPGDARAQELLDMAEDRSAVPADSDTGDEAGEAGGEDVGGDEPESTDGLEPGGRP